jgi:ABC-type sugar transport system ATPase subunit
VRPESISLVPPDKGMLAGTIELIEPLHPDIFVSVDIGGQIVLVRTGSEQRARVGEGVGLNFAPDALHLFDSEGDRIDYAPAASPVLAS